MAYSIGRRFSGATQNKATPVSNTPTMFAGGSSTFNEMDSGLPIMAPQINPTNMGKASFVAGPNIKEMAAQGPTNIAPKYTSAGATINDMPGLSNKAGNPQLGNPYYIGPPTPPPPPMDSKPANPELNPQDPGAMYPYGLSSFHIAGLPYGPTYQNMEENPYYHMPVAQQHSLDYMGRLGLAGLQDINPDFNIPLPSPFISTQSRANPEQLNQAAQNAIGMDVGNQAGWNDAWASLDPGSMEGRLNRMGEGALGSVGGTMAEQAGAGAFQGALARTPEEQAAISLAMRSAQGGPGSQAGLSAYEGALTPGGDPGDYINTEYQDLAYQRGAGTINEQFDEMRRRKEEDLRQRGISDFSQGAPANEINEIEQLRQEALGNLQTDIQLEGLSNMYDRYFRGEELGLQRGGLGLQGTQGLGGLDLARSGVGLDIANTIGNQRLGAGELGLEGTTALGGLGLQQAGLGFDAAGDLARQRLAGGELGLNLGSNLVGQNLAQGQLGLAAQQAQQGRESELYGRDYSRALQEYQNRLSNASMQNAMMQDEWNRRMGLYGAAVNPSSALASQSAANTTRQAIADQQLAAQQAMANAQARGNMFGGVGGLLGGGLGLAFGGPMGGMIGSGMGSAAGSLFGGFF
jgi:hypothetical protein